jgi:hypothetical protein
MPPRGIVVNGRKTAPSLVDLCVNTAIDNLRYLGDVGETDLYLLERILPHCTLDQLMHIEKSSQVRSAAFNLCHFTYAGMFKMPSFNHFSCREEI